MMEANSKQPTANSQLAVDIESTRGNLAGLSNADAMYLSGC